MFPRSHSIKIICIILLCFQRATTSKKIDHSAIFVKSHSFPPPTHQNSHVNSYSKMSCTEPDYHCILTTMVQITTFPPQSYNPQQWGDWRQHLAVMISNPTGTSHKDRASIVALGDTLAARGQLHAAHFCYLVAEVEWGSYTCKDSKLVLIGASHHLPFQVLR